MSTENALQIFNFDAETPIRTEHAPDGGPVVCASDLARTLGLLNPSDAATRIDDDYKVSISTETLGGRQDMIYLREPGVYQLLMTVRLRENGPNHDRIRAFRAFVFEVVLPSIRRSGSFVPATVATPPPPRPTLALIGDEIEATLRVARLFGLEGNQALLATNGRIKRDYGLDPLGMLQIALPSPGNEAQRTPTEIGAECEKRGGKKHSAAAVNQRLYREGWQVAHPSGKGWTPTDLGKNKGGLLLDVSKSHGGGKPVQQLVWVGDDVVDLIGSPEAAGATDAA